MRAAVFTETGGPLSIENIDPAPPGPRRHRATRRQRRLPLRPLAEERLRRHHAGHGPRSRGCGHDRRGRQGSHRPGQGRQGRGVVHPRLRRLLFLPARPVAPLRHRVRGHGPQPGQALRRHRLHDHDRPRHLRRSDDLRPVVDRQGQHECHRRPARADRLRCHHRRGRGAQHRGRSTPARPWPSSAAAVSARPSSRVLASPVRRGSSRSTRSR